MVIADVTVKEQHPILRWPGARRAVSVHLSTTDGACLERGCFRCHQLFQPYEGLAVIYASVGGRMFAGYDPAHGKRGRRALRGSEPHVVIFDECVVIDDLSGVGEELKEHVIESARSAAAADQLAALVAERQSDARRGVGCLVVQPPRHFADPHAVRAARARGPPHGRQP